VPQLVKLRLGTVMDDVLRRRYLRLETAHVEAMRRQTFEEKQAAAESGPDGEMYKKIRLVKELKLQLNELADLTRRLNAGETLLAPDLKKLELGALEKETRAQLSILELEVEELQAKRGGEKKVRKVEAQVEETIWTKEAERLAASEETFLGRPVNAEDLEEGGRSGVAAPYRDPDTHYILTGSLEWRGATKAERRQVIEALATNTKLKTVSMSDSLIDDDLARSWASVLASPTCIIENLTLDSNPIGSAGIEALASALPSNTSLRELKMGNLLSRASRQAEEAIAAALEHHATLIKFSMELKSFHAQTLVRKYISRNENARREARGWSTTETAQLTGGGLYDANWKPSLSKESSAPKVGNTGNGKRVTIASSLWEGFTRKVGDPWVDPNDAPTTEPIFDPLALPQVDPAALDAPVKSSLPFVSLGDLTKGIKNKANEFMSRGGGAKEEQEKKKKTVKSNPLADEVARLALEHEEARLVAVDEAEKRRTTAPPEKRNWHQHLADMLESTGLLPPAAPEDSPAGPTVSPPQTPANFPSAPAAAPAAVSNLEC